MDTKSDAVFNIPPGDGIAILPKGPGIYGMWNRVTRMWNIGQSINIHRRCLLHRNQLRTGTAGNMRIRRDADRYGADSFCFLALELVVDTADMKLLHKLNQLELWWTVHFQAHDERHGYNSESGGCRTTGARFRDRERKLMRHNSRKYELLPGVDIYDPINHVLSVTWVPGG